MKSSFGAVAAALLVFVPSARALEMGSWKPFASFDYYGVGNLSAHNKNTATGFCNAVVAAGFANCSGTSTSYGGYGARGGAMTDVGGVQVGGSFGYIYGGPTTGKGQFNVTPAGATTFQYTNNTFRFLAEARQVYPLSGDWSAAANAGLGMAIDQESTTCSDSGALAGTVCPVASTTKGFATWELGPSLLYRSWELAVRYDGFARGGDLPWNTVNVSAGYRF